MNLFAALQIFVTISTISVICHASSMTGGEERASCSRPAKIWLNDQIKDLYPESGVCGKISCTKDSDCSGMIGGASNGKCCDTTTNTCSVKGPNGCIAKINGYFGWDYGGTRSLLAAYAEPNTNSPGGFKITQWSCASDGSSVIVGLDYPIPDGHRVYTEIYFKKATAKEDSDVSVIQGMNASQVLSGVTPSTLAEMKRLIDSGVF